MVWNDIISWVNDNFAQVGVTGLFILETAKFVTNRLSFNKVYTSTVTPIQSSNSVVFKKVTEAMGKIEKLSSIVEELTTAGIAKDKQIEVLANLVVTTLAVANVPTSAKETFFNSVVKAKVVGDDATLFLSKMIEERKNKETSIQVENDGAIKALNETEV